jgi:hypothetical protein
MRSADLSEHPPAHSNRGQKSKPKSPSLNSEHVRSIVVDIILALITCMLFSLYIQHKQILAVNDMIGRPKYSFLSWFLLSLVTCGIYHFYHEYIKSEDIAIAMGDQNKVEPALHLILNIFGFKIVADALQQDQINRFFSR